MAYRTLTLAEIEALRERPGPKPIALPEARIRQLIQYDYGSQMIKKVLEREGYKASRTTIARRMQEIKKTL